MADKKMLTVSLSVDSDCFPSLKTGAKESDVKKKEPFTTAVMRINLHCNRCRDRIVKTLYELEGCHEVFLDPYNNTLLTVGGRMDMTAVAGKLKKEFNRKVEIVPPPAYSTYQPARVPNPARSHHVASPAPPAAAVHDPTPAAAVHDPSPAVNEPSHHHYFHQDVDPCIIL